MWFFWIFVYVVVCSGAWADLFSALVGMEGMVATEGALLDSLQAYLKSQEDHLKGLRKQFDAYNAEYQMATKDVTNYLANPINVFKIIKRLHLDWIITENIVWNHKPVVFPQIMELKNELVFPDEKDLSAASDAMLRLQNLYMLDSEDISNGKLKGIQYSFPMTASDCFELGHQLANIQLFENATTWLTIAMNKYKDGDPNPITRSLILEWLAHSSIKKGDLDKALNVTRDLLQWEPENEWAKSQLSIFTEIRQKRDTEMHQVPNQNKPRNSYFIKNYAELCRDELDLPEDTKKHLKCRYLTRNDPFLRLAPVKMEEYYLDPYITVYHDVIYDSEIKFLQEISKSRMHRSLVTDFKKNVGYQDTARISKQCWIRDDEGEVVNILSRRVGDLTGLSMESAEPLQVVNYGTGGHYEPHTDYSMKGENRSFNIESDRNGNRLATFIYYLSDVAQGGRTVFPELGVGVTPRKGSALFWYNLHPSGEGNYATLHGGCPVLKGTKWIANKWVRQRGQELGLPCDLEYQDEGMVKSYPTPVLRYNNS